MSISRGRPHRDSSRASSGNCRGSRKVTTGQKKFLRKLLHVLAEIVDENHPCTNEQEPPLSALDLSDDEVDTEINKDGKTNTEIGRLVRFDRLCESYGHLFIPIQHSLNAIGGGGAAARAVGKLRDALKDLREPCFVDESFTDESVDSLYNCSDVVSDMRKAFKDLDILSADFLRQLERIEIQLKVLATKLEVEYGLPLPRGKDENIDWSLEVLTSYLEALLPEFTNIVQKEIPAIRESQSFSTQRYLMMTTVSTFLSSVTATTLQISSSGSISVLTTAINTIWLLSLVFSTTSAIYSLIYMIWRQSPMRLPNVIMPELVHELLKTGPIYLLFGALITFLIGLLLLAFQLGQQQGRLASAAIPFMYGTIHTLIIFALFGWLFYEQFSSGTAWTGDNESENSSQVTSINGDSEAEAEDNSKREAKVSSFIRRLRAMIAKRRNARRTLADEEQSIIDLEQGPDAIDDLPIPGALPSLRLDELRLGGVDSLSHSRETAELGHTSTGFLGIPTLSENNASVSQLSTGNTEDTSVMAYRSFKDLLQFSRDGNYLAHGVSNTIIIYDASNSFVVAHTIRIPDADLLKQVAWSSDGKLLVRTSRRVLVYAPNGTRYPGELVGQLDEAVGPLRCSESITEAEGVKERSKTGSSQETSLDSFEGFSCPIKRSVKIFNYNCKELQSHDLSGLRRSGVRRVVRIIDAMFFREKHILYLANVKYEDDKRGTHCFVANLDSNEVESNLQVPAHCTSFSASRSDGRVIFRGNEPGVYIKDQLTSEWDWYLEPPIKELYRLSDETWNSCKLLRPEYAMVLYGRKDELIVQSSDREVAVLTRFQDERKHASIHLFSTPTETPITKSPISFAIAPQNDVDKDPYLFAFGDEDGSITLWSVQSNKRLAEIERAKEFEVHDYRLGRLKNPTVTTGRALVLPFPLTVSD